MALTLIIGMYMARYLGPGQFGLLSYAVSIVSLFSAIANLGLDDILIRYLIQSPEQRENILGTAFSLKFLGAVLLLAVVLLALNFTSEDCSTKILILIISSGMLFQSINVIGFYFHSQILARLTTYAQSLSLCISSAIKLILITVNASLVWFAWVISLENLILALFFIIIYRRQKLSPYQWGFKPLMAVRLLSESWPLILSGLTVSIYMRIDQIMIKEMIGPAAVGNYAVAVRLSEAWYFIPMAITSSLFPAIINAKNSSHELYHARFQRLYELLTWMSIAIAIPITFLAEDIIMLLFGGEFLLAAGVFKIYIWSGVFVFLGVASSRHLLIENLNKISLIRTFLGCVVNIVLNLILIPRVGINGAAWATLISYAVANFSLIVDTRARQIFYMMLYAFMPLKLLNKAE